MGAEEEKIIGGEHAGKWERAKPLKLSLKVCAQINVSCRQCGATKSPEEEGCRGMTKG